MEIKEICRKTHDTSVGPSILVGFMGDPMKMEAVAEGVIGRGCWMGGEQTYVLENEEKILYATYGMEAHRAFRVIDVTPGEVEKAVAIVKEVAAAL